MVIRVYHIGSKIFLFISRIPIICLILVYLTKISVEAPIRFLINNSKNKIPGTCCALVFFSTYFCGCSFLLTQKLNELLFLFFKRKLIFFPKHNNKIIIHQSVDPKMHIKRIKWRPRRGCSCTVRGTTLKKRDIFLQRR